MGELFKVIALARGCELDPIGFRVGDRSHRALSASGRFL